MPRRLLVSLLALALAAIRAVVGVKTTPAAAAAPLPGWSRDITGPAAENGMIGYSKFGQDARGGQWTLDSGSLSPIAGCITRWAGQVAIGAGRGSA
jgi:hypothetical protein